MKKTILFFLFSVTTLGQSLDPTFDNDGIKTQTISNSPSNQIVYDAITQPDGKILLGGKFIIPNIGSMVLRLNSDGSKDNTFNHLGFKRLNTNTGIQSISIQSNGKILAAGRNSIFRLNSNGSTDTSFNNTGVFNILFPGLHMNIKKISVQPDGKIIATGDVVNTASNSELAIIRLNSDGSLDTTFNLTGYKIIAFGSRQNNAFSHKILNDGKIIIVGDYLNSSLNYDFTITRLESNGILDSTFGVDGIATLAFGATSRDQARDLSILPNGKIFVIGASDNKLAFSMFNIDGSLDLTYNNTGKYITPFNINYSTNSISLISNHVIPKIIQDTSGNFLISLTSDGDFKVLRFLSDAITLDHTFNGNGIVSQDNLINDVATFITLKTDGKIVTGGFSNTTLGVPLPYPNSILKLIEINPNGSIYSNTTKELYQRYDSSNFTTISPIDQSIFTTTNSIVDGNIVLVITKHTQNGTLDTSFGNNGSYNLQNPNDDNTSDKLIILNDNSLIVTIGYGNIYKLTSSGIPDTSFGTNGIVDLFELTNYKIHYIDCVKLSTDNKIVIAAFYDSGNNDISSCVMKLNLDGSIDTNFGNLGYVVYRFNPDSVNYSEFPYSMIVENDNKITIASISFLKGLEFPASSKNYMARLNIDGSFDNTFGQMGKISNDINIINYPVNLIKIDNEYLLNLIVYDETSLKISKTLKLASNGSINTSFGVNGISDDVLNSFNSAIILQPDGKYLKSGRNNSLNHISTSRYLSNGNVDTNFGINGEKNEFIGLISDASDINLLNDGKILITGNSSDSDNQVLTLVKYTDLALGVLSLEKENYNLLVYPNPIQDIVTFEFTINDPEILTIDIIDLQGKYVKNIKSNYYYSANQHKLEANFNGLNAGNYILNIKNSKNNKQTINIVKK